MAKVIGPLGSSEARGKVGGLIYNTWRGISTVKVKHAPSQPRTALQLALRAIAISLIRAWAACVNQIDWNAYAAIHPYVDGMGNSIRATGANWYVALNTRLLRNSVPAVETAPVLVAPGAPTLFTAVGAAGAITISATNTDPLTESVEYWLDGPHSAGRIGSLARARFQMNVVGDGAEHALYVHVVGVYNVYARSIDLTTGLVSTWLTASAAVT